MNKIDCSMSKNDIIINLKHGLDSEYRALEGYRDLIRLIDDKTDQNKLEMVIADEEKHIEMVEHLINMVNEEIK